MVSRRIFDSICDNGTSETLNRASRDTSEGHVCRSREVRNNPPRNRRRYTRNGNSIMLEIVRHLANFARFAAHREVRETRRCCRTARARGRSIGAPTGTRIGMVGHSRLSSELRGARALHRSVRVPSPVASCAATRASASRSPGARANPRWPTGTGRWCARRTLPFRSCDRCTGDRKAVQCARLRLAVPCQSDGAARLGTNEV